MSNSKRLYYLDFVKLSLLIVVILSHSIKVVNDDWFVLGIDSVSWLRYLSQWLSTFHVQAFTMVAGYIFFYLYIENYQYQDFKQFVKTKFFRLIVPYFFISLVWIIPVNTVLFKLSLKDIFFDFLLMENPSQLWFIVMLFGVYIVARLFKHFPIEHPLVFAVILGVLFILGLYLGRLMPNFFQIAHVFQYLIFFYLGFFLRKYKRFEFVIEDKIWIVFLCDVVLFVAYLFVDKMITGILLTLANIFFEFLLAILGSLLSLFSFKLIGSYYEGGGVTEFLVKRCMIMYLIHNQFNFIAVNLLYYYLPTMSLALVCFLITITMSLLVSMLLYRYKVTRFLVGG